MASFWVQIDVQLEDLRARFFMTDCGGHDHVALEVNKGGWRACEPPLSEVIAKLCKGLKPVFIEVGGGTGFYSLLAAACGARTVWVSEGVPASLNVLMTNVAESSHRSIVNYFKFDFQLLEDALSLHADSSGKASADGIPLVDQGSLLQLAQLDDLLLHQLDAFAGQEIFLKIDANAFSSIVIQGSGELIRQFRPIIALKVLPGADEVYFQTFCEEQNYMHLWLRPNVALSVDSGRFTSSLDHRNHLLIPSEKAGAL